MTVINAITFLIDLTALIYIYLFLNNDKTYIWRWKDEECKCSYNSGCGIYKQLPKTWKTSVAYKKNVLVIFCQNIIHNFTGISINPKTQCNVYNSNTSKHL